MEFSMREVPVVAAGETALDVAGRLLREIRGQLQRQIGSLPSKQSVLDAAGAAYDKYIKPIDIPGVPPLIEPWVDQMLKSLFLRFVSGVYDQLQSM